MTARFTSKDLSLRVEDGDTTVLISATHGHTWVALGAFEARAMGHALCAAAERLEERDTERSAA